MLTSDSPVLESQLLHSLADNLRQLLTPPRLSFLHQSNQENLKYIWSLSLPKLTWYLFQRCSQTREDQTELTSYTPMGPEFFQAHTKHPREEIITANGSPEHVHKEQSTNLNSFSSLDVDAPSRCLLPEPLPSQTVVRHNQRSCVLQRSVQTEAAKPDSGHFFPGHSCYSKAVPPHSTPTAGKREGKLTSQDNPFKSPLLLPASAFPVLAEL